MGSSIVITGANSLTGRGVIQRLRERQGIEVIALTRSENAIDADKVITAWLTASAAHAALREADVIVHLCGELHPGKGNSYRAAHVETAAAVAAALQQGRARRVISISHVLARLDSPNEYLRTKAEADRLFLGSGKEAVIFRGTAFLGSPHRRGPLEDALTARNGKPVRLLGSGRQRHRPVFRGDVEDAIVAAIGSGRPGQYELAGPEEMTANEMVRLINRPDVPIAHTPAWAARLLSHVLPGLPQPFVDLMLQDATADPAALCREFDLTLTSLRTIWS